MKLNKLEYWLMNNPVRRWIQLKVIIFDFLKFKNGIKGKKLLEIGCGNGRGALIINKWFEPSQIIGIDVDPKMINFAKDIKQKNLVFEVGDASKLKFKNNLFDGVINFSIIHHISNWKKTINEMFRVLNAGGLIYIEDLSIESFEMPIIKKIRKHLNHPYNSMYTRKQFLDYLNYVGFEILHYKSHNFLGLLKYFTVVATKKSNGY